MRVLSEARFIRSTIAIILLLIVYTTGPITAHYHTTPIDIIQAGGVTGNSATTTISADVIAAQGTASATAIATALEALQAQLPEGLAWTNDLKYTSTCTINGQRYNYTGYGCAAFALIFEDLTYGTANASYTKTAACDVSVIKSGDIVRVPTQQGGHSYVILSLDATGATIVEGNYNNSVHWGRHVSIDELAVNTYVLSRNINQR